MMRTMQIIQYDNTDTSILRSVSALIPLPDITSPAVQDYIAQLKATLDNEGDGVGISAVQVGNPVRLFILSHKAYEVDKKTAPAQHRVFINPRITKVSKDRQIFEEGCLSIRGVYGEVERAFGITLQAFNEQGELFIEQANGFVAQVIQHEMDHLDGTLFIDHTKELRYSDTYETPAE